MLDLLDSDVEGYNGEINEVFFSGSDDELGFVEEIEDGGRLVYFCLNKCLHYLMLM